MSVMGALVENTLFSLGDDRLNPHVASEGYTKGAAFEPEGFGALGAGAFKVNEKTTMAIHVEGSGNSGGARAAAIAGEGCNTTGEVSRKHEERKGKENSASGESTSAALCD
jgi:hypothetical protein